MEITLYGYGKKTSMTKLLTSIGSTWGPGFHQTPQKTSALVSTVHALSVHSICQQICKVTAAFETSQQVSFQTVCCALSSMEMFQSTAVGTTGLQQLKETNSSEQVSRERLGTTPASESMRDSTLWPAGPSVGLWRSMSTDYTPYVTAQLFATTDCQAWRESCKLTVWLIRGLTALDNYPSDMVVYWVSWFDEEGFICDLTALSLLFFYLCILPPFSFILLLSSLPWNAKNF